MTSLEIGGRVETVRRAVIGGPQRLGVTESLETPGLVPLPAVSREAGEIGQVMQALGLSADAAGTAIQLSEQASLRTARASDRAAFEQERSTAQRQRAEEDAAREAERLAREAEQFDRGAAAESAEARVPLLLEEIRSGRIAVPEGRAVDEYFTAWAESQAAGQSEAFRAEWRRRIVPDMVRETIRVQEGIKAESRELLAQDAIRPALGSRDAEEYQRSMRALTDTLQIPETEARAMLAVPAMQAAALRGDAEAFRVASTFADGIDPIAEGKAAITLEERLNQTRRAEVQGVQDSIAGMLLQRSAGDGVTYDTVRKAIDASKATVGEDEALRLHDEIDRREAAEIREQLDRLASAERSSIRQEAIDGAVAATLGARTSGGGVAAIPEIDMELSDGSRLKVGREEMREAVVSEALSRIQNTSSSPEEAFGRTVEYLSLNNFTHPVWRDTLASGAGAGVAAIFAEQPDAPMPAATTQGYELYKRLPESLRATHADARSQFIYDMAQAAEETIDAGQPEASLRRAIMAQQTGLPLPDISLNRVGERAPWTKRLANSYEVQHRIRRSAQLLMLTNGGNTEKAVDRAAAIEESRSIRIGAGQGRVSLRLNPETTRDVPQNLGVLSRETARAHAARNSADPNDFALMPTAVPGILALHDLRGVAATIADGPDEQIFFSIAELQRLEEMRAIAPEQKAVRFTDGELAAARNADAARRQRASDPARLVGSVERYRRQRDAILYPPNSNPRYRSLAAKSELERRLTHETDPDKVDQIIRRLNEITP